MAKRLSEFSRGIKLERVRGQGDPLVSGLSFDTRSLRPGELYFALPGIHGDGKSFVAEAVAKGASAVVFQGQAPAMVDGPVYLRVEQARASMAPIASAFFDAPSRSLATIGVTGTEGKSTTVWLCYQLLELAGLPSGFISTVQRRLAAEVEWNAEHQTTPESPIVQECLARMRDNGLEYAVLEASSHGLSERLGRLANVEFDVGVFTNVTHEHLEFHGSLEAYRADKARLFRALSENGHYKELGSGGRQVPSFGVVNADDPNVGIFLEASSRPCRSFSLRDLGADLCAQSIVSDHLGSDFELRILGRPAPIHCRLGLPGGFNVANCMAALLAVSGILGRKVEDFLEYLPRLVPVRGRMTRLERGQGFEVIVDYAHTPSSFEAVLPVLKRATSGRLICLFGSGGERDREKRPMQGEIASRNADILVLTDEDPRGEDRLQLLGDIAKGCWDKEEGRDLFIVPDRPSAIRQAFSLARPGDCVALLGKGHENSIIGRDGPKPYDEIREAEAALAELGFRG